jgi:hypothetical protein
MLEDAGIIVVILLAVRGYFACASDLGRMFKVHFCEAPEDEHDTTEQLSKRSTTITSPPSYGFRVVEK